MQTTQQQICYRLINMFIAGAILSLFTLNARAQTRPPSANYVYTQPVQLNDGIKTGNLFNAKMDSSKIVKLTKLILTDTFPNIHSLLIVKDNKLVYENYFAGKDQVSGKKLGYIEHGINDLHDCRSISKSIVSACIGIALQKGLIKSVDEPVFNYFPEYKKFNDSVKDRITIRHLLTMTSGLKWNENISYANLGNSELRMDLSFNPIKYILKRKMVSAPGATWNYNGGGTQLLAEIIKKVSGLSIDNFAEKYLFGPLRINTYKWTHLVIKNEPAAASGLRLRSRDLLKFGLLYMNNGKWNDTLIISSDWVQQSLSALVNRPSSKPNIAENGYGYQFWTYTAVINGKSIQIAEAKGNGGQSIFFCRSLNLLVVTTAGNYNQWDIANNTYAALVDYIIPAIK
jgi:CubicO group peptidase (beta-lactamase class C family)